ERGRCLPRNLSNPVNQKGEMTMKPILTDADRRLERVYRRLGTRTPACTCCSESYPHALERHHIAGRAFHDDEAIVCRNCHRKLSDPQIDRENLDCMDPWL